MIVLLTTLFIFLCLFLVLFILLQQGKGDLGLGGLGGAGQSFFGGSGGQEFFEKATWTMGAIFMVGALGLAMLKTGMQESRLKEYQSPLTIEKTKKPTPQTVSTQKKTTNAKESQPARQEKK